MRLLADQKRRDGFFARNLCPAADRIETTTDPPPLIPQLLRLDQTPSLRSGVIVWSKRVSGMLRWCLLLVGAVSLCSAGEAVVKPPNAKALPPDAHHPTPKPDRLREAERLTREQSGRLPGDSSETPAARNFVDEHLFGTAAKAGVRVAPLCSDQEFLRRVSLDLTGRLPEPAALRAFLAGKAPGKRDKVIDEILYTTTKGVTRRPQTPFLDRWTYFLADLYRLNGLMGRGQTLFYNHIYNSLVVSQPYDEFVRDMLTSTARSNHFNAPVNLFVRSYVDESNQSTVNHEDTFDEFAIRTTKMFLGINLECVSCHDGRGHLEKVNRWLTARKRSEVWRTAAFFSKMRMYRPYGDLWDEFVVSNEGKGYYDTAKSSVIRPPRYKADVAPAFVLTGERPGPGEDPRAAYARVLTGNPQFARHFVNLVWAEMFGAGLVEPVMDWDLERYGKPSGDLPSQTLHPELLDALAKDFEEHRYDLRHLVRVLATSSAYQLSHRYPGEWRPEYAGYFARRMIRRMPAEQVWDAISQSTGVFEDFQAGNSGTKVKYVMQTVSPGDLGEALLRVLMSFGFDDRTFSTRSLGVSAVQSSALMNNELVKAKLKVDAKGRLQTLLRAEPPKPNREIAEELFLAALSRFPSKEESAWAERILAGQHERGAEDVLWALVNKTEFLLNY